LKLLSAIFKKNKEIAEHENQLSNIWPPIVFSTLGDSDPDFWEKAYVPLDYGGFS